MQNIKQITRQINFQLSPVLGFPVVQQHSQPYVAACVYVTFYVLVVFFIRLHFSAHGPESQYDNQSTNFRKRLENTQKFTFDFVAFLCFLSILKLL